MKKIYSTNTRKNIIFGAALSLFICTPSFAAKNLCPKISKRYQSKITKKFKQNPFVLVETFLNAPVQQNLNGDVDSQNLLMKSGFDVSRIYKSNIKNFKSKALSQNLFDWVRTQYFGNLEKSLYSKNKQLLRENTDLFSSREQQQMSSTQSYATSISPYKCSKKEAQLLGCKNSYIVTAQTAAAVSCKDKKIKPAFESHFYLTYSKKYGFKILDVAISGKRIVLDSLKHMMSLKRKGFNKTAIASHISILSEQANTFKLPRKQVNTKRFLATFKNADPDRLPSSL